MSVMIDSALKITFGLALKKLRCCLGDRLKDGGLNSQMVREVIAGKLAEVKQKLDGLARSDLLSSVSFLQEGLRTLSSPLSNMAGNEISTAGVSSAREDSVLNSDSTQKLVDAIGELKISSTDLFVSAMESFKNANTKATEAFHNEALSIEDRILAVRLRVQSKLLISLENPNLATTCKLYLEELHSIPTVVEIFRNAIEGGVLSYLKKRKRLKLALSVSVINFTVFRFLKSFTKGPVNMYDWPMIKRDDWMYNTLIPEKGILKKLEKAEEEVPWLMLLTEVSDFDPSLAAVDSKGDLILYREVMRRVTRDTRELLRVTNSSAEMFYSFPTETLEMFGTVLFIATDSDNNVLLFTTSVSEVTCGEFSSSSSLIKIHGIDALGNKIENFGDESVFSHGFMVMSPTPENCVYAVCMPLLRAYPFSIPPGSFFLQTEKLDSSMATITDECEVVAVAKSGYVVRVYQKDGQLEKEFDLHEGENEDCKGITFNNLTKEVVVVSCIRNSHYLSTYLHKTGERRHHVRLPQYLICGSRINLTSHSSGVIALITYGHVLFIQ